MKKYHPIKRKRGLLARLGERGKRVSYYDDSSYRYNTWEHGKYSRWKIRGDKFMFFHPETPADGWHVGCISVDHLRRLKKAIIDKTVV